MAPGRRPGPRNPSPLEAPVLRATIRAAATPARDFFTAS